jgi:hypothetical protein
MLKLSYVSETFTITLNDEVTDADPHEIADEEAHLAAKIVLNTSVILQQASTAKSEGKLSIVAKMTKERLYCQTNHFAFLPSAKPHFQ